MTRMLHAILYLQLGFPLVQFSEGGTPLTIVPSWLAIPWHEGKPRGTPCLAAQLTNKTRQLGHEHSSCYKQVLGAVHVYIGKRDSRPAPTLRVH